MTEERVPSDPAVLTEELAHRLLTRAVELDVVEGSGTPLTRLREVAREIGISDAAFWGALGLASRFTRAVGGGWELHAGLAVAVNVAGLLLARRFRAGPVAFVLAITAVAQLAEYLIHLVYGIQSAQGAGAHFAVLLAAGLGIAVTRLLRTPPVERTSEAKPLTSSAAEPEQSHWSLLQAAEPPRRGLAGMRPTKTLKLAGQMVARSRA